MTITVELVGEGSKEVDPTGRTYGELLDQFDVSQHEVSLLVDGTPVPEDKPVESTVDRVQIIRLIKGG